MSLDLNKQKVLDLKKAKGIDGQFAQVVFCVDYSGSMSSLYRSGAVQKVLERLFPVAMAFDDNQSMDFILFQYDYRKCPEVTPANVVDYVNKIALKQWYDMGGTNYAPSLREVILPMVTDIKEESYTETETSTTGLFMWFGQKTETHSVVKTREIAKMKKVEYPVYVIFLTDGDCSDKSDTYKVVRELSHAGAFIQFIGIGGDSFNTLQKLDDLDKRELDNADFFAVYDIDGISDDELYDKLMTEFPAWIPQARSKWFIE